MVSQYDVKGLKKQKQKMDTFLSVIHSRTFTQNIIPMKNNVLAEVSSKGGRKAFRVKIRNKMLLQTTMILHM